MGSRDCQPLCHFPVPGEFVISIEDPLPPLEQPEQRGMPPQAPGTGVTVGVQVPSSPSELYGLAFFLPDHTFQTWQSWDICGHDAMTSLTLGCCG